MWRDVPASRRRTYVSIAPARGSGRRRVYVEIGMRRGLATALARACRRRRALARAVARIPRRGARQRRSRDARVVRGNGTGAMKPRAGKHGHDCLHMASRMARLLWPPPVALPAGVGMCRLDRSSRRGDAIPVLVLSFVFEGNYPVGAMQSEMNLNYQPYRPAYICRDVPVHLITPSALSRASTQLVSCLPAAMLAKVFSSAACLPLAAS